MVQPVVRRLTKEETTLTLEPLLDLDTIELRNDRSAGTDETPTLARQVYQELESRILDGQWLPNTKVSLRTLAISLNTSMQPVREAVGRLVAASALEITPGRAIRVPPLDRGVADEIWSMRLLLEGEAAARFAARQRAEEAHRLFDYTRSLRSFRYGIDLQPTMRVIMAWNRDLVEGSASPILIEMVSRLRLRYAPFLADALSLDLPFDEEFLQFTLHIQDELVLAIESGDAAAARHLRCADLRSFQRYLYSRKGWKYQAV
jgi:DNA-binding GntR family transcriptional regulator